MKVLIPGIAGLLARNVAKRLLAQGHEVIGIDPRGWPGAPEEIELHPMDIRKRAAEEVFRHHRPEAVIHMATVSALAGDAEERYRSVLAARRAILGEEHLDTPGLVAVLQADR